MRKSVIAAAAGFHVAAAAVVYLAGRSSLLAPLLDEHGVMTADAQGYRAQAAVLADVLARGGPGPWFFALLPVHVKLYSLCFALFAGWVGPSVLAVEPLNVALFLAALGIVYKLGEEAFDGRCGRLAAAAVGLWPSFLLHTTQPLRDPLFVAAALLFFLFNSRWLTETYTPRRALKAAALASLTAFVLWLSRSSMWELMIGVVFVTALLLGARMLREGRVLWGNAAGAASLLVLSLLLPAAAARFYEPAYRWAQSRGVAFMGHGRVFPDGARPAEAGAGRGAMAHLPARISALREGFVRDYAGAGSNIDTGVRFESTSDVIGHLPRALAVGLFAPFPRAWFGAGAQTGRIGRAVAAAETLALYAVELLALAGLWRGRNQLSAWLLLAVSLAGATALGLVVTNVGALYRMRYAFVMPLIILACEGVKQIAPRGRAGEGRAEDL